MARGHVMHKPGEKAPQDGPYYCYICAMRGEESACEMKRGQMFVECPKCLERNVPEWDMTWKSEADRAGKSRTTPWPGYLGSAR